MILQVATKESAMLLLFISMDNLPIWLAIIAVVMLFSMRNSMKQPIKQRMSKDIIQLKQFVNTLTTQLVPWKNEELELLSLNTTQHTSPSRKSPGYTGVFTSIYQEPLFAYGYKPYMKHHNHMVLHAQTQKNEYFFYQYPTEIVVQVNGGLELGRILDDKLYSTNGKIIGSYLYSSLENNTAIIIGNKDYGHIRKKGNSNNDINPRALEFVDTNMDADTRVVFEAMLIWKLVTNL